MKEKLSVRSAAVAGMFYDDSPTALRKNIDDMLNRAQVHELKGTVRALIAPHAGYVYSGFTAAHAYKFISGQTYYCVIVIGPSHREYFDGVSVYSGDAYETPLGRIPINSEIRDALVKEGDIISSNAGHRSEHSIEVQLPFLQRVLGEFSFVPVIMGDQKRRHCNALSNALQKVAADKNILIVASSDLSHYHPYDEAVSLDKRVIHEIEGFNSNSFLEKFEHQTLEACGGGPIATIMETAKQLGADKAEVLHYCNSGDVIGDKSAVVGYLAAAFFEQKVH